MRAVHSSSALAVNSFSPFKRRVEELRVLDDETEFTELRFEAKCPTGLQGTAPHLDLVLTNENSVLGVESKLTEPLAPKQAKFTESYDALAERRGGTNWFAHLRFLRENPAHYKWVDAAQLIKHALGLMNCFEEKERTLVYLYWRPLNWEEIDAYRGLNEEIQNLQAAVADKECGFAYLSYNELWQRWERLLDASWKDHLRALKGRYQLEL